MEAVLNTIAVYGAALDWLTWVAGLGAAVVYGAGAWFVYRLIRLALGAAIRLLRIRRYIRQLESYANHPGAQRLQAAVDEHRKEEL